MRSTIKVALSFCALITVALFSVVIANNAKQNVASVAQLCEKAQRVEFLQNQKGEKFELNFLDKDEFARYNVSDNYDFVWGDQDCVETTGNCGRIKSDTYVVVLSN